MECQYRTWSERDWRKRQKNKWNKLLLVLLFQRSVNEPAIRLAKKIADLAPPSLNAVFFTSGGSESNDSAIKLVRHYWKIQGQPERNKIISLSRGYHGLTAGATSATGIPEFWNMAGTYVDRLCPCEISI